MVKRWFTGAPCPGQPRRQPVQPGGEITLTATPARQHRAGATARQRSALNQNHPILCGGAFRARSRPQKAMRIRAHVLTPSNNTHCC